MSSSVQGARRRRLKPDQRRAELIAIGVDHFATRAYDDVRMEDVAHAASVSRALLYRYFPDKRTLFIAVVGAVADQMLEKTVAEIDLSASPFQQARGAVLGYLSVYEKYPTVAQAIFQNSIAADPRMRERDDYDRHQQAALVVSQIRLLNGQELDPRDARLLSVVASAWTGFVEQAVRDWVLAPILDRALVADMCAHVLLDTLLRMPGLTESARQQLTLRGSVE